MIKKSILILIAMLMILSPSAHASDLYPSLTTIINSVEPCYDPSLDLSLNNNLLSLSDVEDGLLLCIADQNGELYTPNAHYLEYERPLLGDEFQLQVLDVEQSICNQNTQSPSVYILCERVGITFVAHVADKGPVYAYRYHVTFIDAQSGETLAWIDTKLPSNPGSLVSEVNKYNVRIVVINDGLDMAHIHENLQYNLNPYEVLKKSSVSFDPNLNLAQNNSLISPAYLSGSVFVIAQNIEDTEDPEDSAWHRSDVKCYIPEIFDQTDYVRPQLRTEALVKKAYHGGILGDNPDAPLMILAECIGYRYLGEYVVLGKVYTHIFHVSFIDIHSGEVLAWVELEGKGGLEIAGASSDMNEYKVVSDGNQMDYSKWEEVAAFLGPIS